MQVRRPCGRQQLQHLPPAYCHPRPDIHPLTRKFPGLTCAELARKPEIFLFESADFQRVVERHRQRLLLAGSGAHDADGPAQPQSACTNDHSEAAEPDQEEPKHYRRPQADGELTDPNLLIRLYWKNAHIHPEWFFDASCFWVVDGADSDEEAGTGGDNVGDHGFPNQIRGKGRSYRMRLTARLVLCFPWRGE